MKTSCEISDSDGTDEKNYYSSPIKSHQYGLTTYVIIIKYMVEKNLRQLRINLLIILVVNVCYRVMTDEIIIEFLLLEPAKLSEKKGQFGTGGLTLFVVTTRIMFPLPVYLHEMLKPHMMAVFHDGTNYRISEFSASRI